MALFWVAVNACAKTALDRLPEEGAPIHVGHHSETRHRNAIIKADTAMRRSVDASAGAAPAKARADAAIHTNDVRYQPVRVANRAGTLGWSCGSWDGASTRTITTAKAGTKSRLRSRSMPALSLSPRTLRKNAKTVGDTSDHSWSNTVHYAEIQQHQRPEQN